MHTPIEIRCPNALPLRRVAALCFAAHSFTVRCVVYVAYMGRRSRQVEQQRHERERTRAARDRMARVQVSDETWAAYRALLGTVPVSRAIGRLIEREVASHRRRTALDADSVTAAVQEARVVTGELETLIGRLEAASRWQSDSRWREPRPNVLFD